MFDCPCCWFHSPGRLRTHHQITLTQECQSSWHGQPPPEITFLVLSIWPKALRPTNIFLSSTIFQEPSYCFLETKGKGQTFSLAKATFFTTQKTTYEGREKEQRGREHFWVLYLVVVKDCSTSIFPGYLSHYIPFLPKKKTQLGFYYFSIKKEEKEGGRKAEYFDPNERFLWHPWPKVIF